MLDFLSVFLYAMCLALPFILMVVLAGALHLISKKFPRLEKLILGDYFTDDDDDELFGENDFYE